MQEHDQGVMRPPHLHRAPRQKRAGVAPGIGACPQPLRGDEADDDVGPKCASRRAGHRYSGSIIRKAVEKPGPSALIKVRAGLAMRFIRSSTTMAVTADMLP